MRASLSLCLLALAACVLLASQACSAQPVEELAPPLLSRHRREGEVKVDVDRNRGEKPRVTVQGEGNVWKGEGQRRVDVRGSADNRGGRGAGVSFKW